MSRSSYFIIEGDVLAFSSDDIFEKAVFVAQYAHPRYPERIIFVRYRSPRYLSTVKSVFPSCNVRFVTRDEASHFGYYSSNWILKFTRGICPRYFGFLEKRSNGLHITSPVTPTVSAPSLNQRT